MNNMFTHKDFEILNRDVPYEGVLRIARYKIRIKLYNGGDDVLEREVMERKPAAGVLPYDPVTDQVLLIEQFRAGALNSTQSPWLIEIVAGIIDKNENEEKVVIREAKEEAGCEIVDLFPICDYFVSPGGCNEYIHLFCGRIDAYEAGGVFGLEEEHEDIRAFTLPSDDAFALLAEGKIKTSPAIITLQWLQLNREWLRRLWQAK